MTMLSDSGVRERLQSGEIEIQNFDERLLKRNSYVLRLGDRFRFIASGTEVVDICDPASLEAAAGAEIVATSIVVGPGEMVLGISSERIGIAPDLVGYLTGVSNVARAGVSVHPSSSFVNAGYGYKHPGSVVFEISTIGNNTIRLHAGMPLCHLAFFVLDGPTSYELKSDRTGQYGPDPSTYATQFGHFVSKVR